MVAVVSDGSEIIRLPLNMGPVNELLSNSERNLIYKLVS